MLQIKEKKDCTGCHACFNRCPQESISMETDAEGFWYPLVDQVRCSNCGLCEIVCPVKNRIVINNQPKAYACMSKEDNIRLESSSGGIFTLIAENVLNDGGVVFGVKFDNDFTVVHDYIETMEGLEKFRGSKYVQSRIGGSYKMAKDFLNQGKKALFSGTPCQIAGLKSFLGKDFENLFTVDLICHGVPSPKVWEEYKKYRERIACFKTREISFRRKYEGWKLFSLLFIFENGKEYTQTFNKDLFMRAFLKDISLRPSCYNCRFKSINRESDITLGDFWGIQNILPEMDDDKGTSLIFINSDKGKEIFEKIKDKMEYKQVDIEQAIRYNSAAVKSDKYHPKREDFFKELGRTPFDKLVKKYCSDPLPVRVKKGARALLRSILSLPTLFDRRFLRLFDREGE
jgi:coenzyme F420-reducing hydrogenase beta subunit